MAVTVPKDGVGSAGSWREPDVDTTRHGDHDAAAIQVGGHHHRVPLIQRREANGNSKPMRFVSLHGHTTFSYLDGYQLPEAHIRRANELNMTKIAFTEHGNIDSHVKAEAAAEKAGGASLIYGCEVYMPSGPDWFRDDAKTQRKHHLTILAKNAEGYMNLLALISESWVNFYHEPTVTWESLCRLKKGLVVLSGCQGSLLFCATVGGKGIESEDASFKRGLRIARRFAEEFGRDYFIEVQAFPELELTRRFNALAGRMARRIKRRLVATMDVHYTLLEEAEVQKILHNLRPGNKQTLEEQVRDWGYNVPLCPPPNDRSIYRRLMQTGLSSDEAIQAIVSTEEIADECSVELPKLPMVRFPVPAGFEDAKAYWRHQIREGWKFRGCHKWPRARRVEAKAMLRHEMELIEGKDFVDYFLLIASGVVFTKDQGVPCIARGSANASVAGWLLRITEVCPLDFPFLRFDRFISVDRMDLPDIDIDTPGEFRPALREFYESMLGPGCVNNVGTFTQFKGRNSLDDVARVFRVPKFEVNTIKDFLIERSSGDLRASSTIEDTIDQFPQAREAWERNPDLAKGALLEGNLKAFGIHAAGIILSNQPITSVTAVLEKEVPKGSGNFVQAIAMDKKDAERQGLLKADFLGLNTMSMIDDAINWLGMSMQNIYDLPLDDPKVFKRFQERDFVGIFQFDGRANRYVGGSVRPDRISEIMDCIALCRPGPLHNGGAREYADVKWGAKLLPRHPAIESVVGLTKGQIIYQEQVLDIMRLIGGFDHAGVSSARRIIAKKEGEQAFSRLKDDFMKGVATLHKRTDYPPMEPEEGANLFGDCITSGAYAFNAAHSAGYAPVSYWTMWLKTYHIDVFYAAALGQSMKDEERTHALLRDADKHGVRVLKPSAKRSGARWLPVRKGTKPGDGDFKTARVRVPTIRAGFQSIEGIGPKTAENIVEYAEKIGMESWGDLINVKGIGDKTVEKIEDWLLSDDPHGAFRLLRDIADVKEEIAAGRLHVPKPTHTAQDLPFEQGQHFKVVWLGTVLERNIRDIFETNRARKGEELKPEEVKAPHLNEWAQLTAEDETDQLLLKVDRFKYPRFKAALFDFRLGHDLLLVEGVRPRYVSSRQIKVNNLYVIEP